MGFVVFCCFLRRFWKLLQFLLKIQFFWKPMSQILKNDTNRHTGGFFYVPIHFASLSSFHSTFFGLLKFRKVDFWPIFSILSNFKSANLLCMLQSKEQIVGINLLRRLFPNFCRNMLWPQTRPFFDVLKNYPVNSKTKSWVEKNQSCKSCVSG